jgi:hypothetical protein
VLVDLLRLAVLVQQATQHTLASHPENLGEANKMSIDNRKSACRQRDAMSDIGGSGDTVMKSRACDGNEELVQRVYGPWWAYALHQYHGACRGRSGDPTLAVTCEQEQQSVAGEKKNPGVKHSQ